MGQYKHSLIIIAILGLLIIMSSIFFNFVSAERAVTPREKMKSELIAANYIVDNQQTLDDVEITFMDEKLVVPYYYDVGTFSLVLAMVESSDDPLTTLEIVQGYDRLKIESDIEKKILQIIERKMK